MFAIGAGTSGFTAYVGFYEICKPKRARKFLFLVHMDTLWDSMRNSGCYVDGSAGTNEKVLISKGLLLIYILCCNN